MTVLHLDLDQRGYDINIGRGLLSRAEEFLNLQRRVLIVTDSGVPKEYAETVKNLSSEAVIFTVPEGEGSKSIETYSDILSEMAKLGMTRSDCVVAVGGGVVGDLAGFVSASYMRGVDFYNIPTTLLSQVDSSIGGKTAVNLGGIKNIVGAFYQPKAVLIDPDTLKTLPKRQVSNGLAEVIKMAATSDRELFEFMEKCEMNDENIEKIIINSLKIKKSVVEADEREGGLRRVLNFGHTLGHAIESAEGMSGLYHGECVGLGMLYVSAPEARERIYSLLKKCGLPTEYARVNEALDFVNHDKKLEGKSLSCVLVDEIGSFNIKKMTTDEFARIIKEGYNK